LAELGREEALQEILSARAWVREHSPAATDWLTYPYGLRTLETISLVSDALTGALRVDGGLALAGGNARGSRYDLPRVNIPRGLSLEGLGLRLAGLLA
jgi:hypothetical protein